MADITVRVNDAGQIEGDLPDVLQAALKKQFDAGFGKGAEKTAKEALAQLDAERKRLAQGDPVEREKVRQMEDELTALRLKEAEREKRYEDAIRMREDAHLKALQAEQQDKARYQTRVKELLGSEIRAAAVAAGARQESLPELVKLLSSDLHLDEQLQPVVTGPDGQPLVDPKTRTPVTIEGFVAGYLDTHPHHRTAPVAGGGARGGQLLSTGTAFNPAAAEAAVALSRLETDRSTEAVASAFDALRAARAPRS
jgi:hypothetical protein